MKRVFAASCAALAAACAVGPEYRPPATTAPARFGETSAEGALPDAWWTTFHDPTLDALVLRAVKSNPDLMAAQSRVREARALRGVASAARFPTANVSGDASRSRTSDNVADFPGLTSNLFQAGFDASWELDVFGGVRRSVEAADADVAASVEDRRDVLVTLVAEVARDYVDLRGAQRRAAIARDNLAAQNATLDLTRKRLAGGVATDLDVARAEAQVQTTASTVPTFDAAARQAMHALAALVAAPSDALVAELGADGAQPPAPPSAPAGLPSELLRRRPDVRRAERRLAAATARIGVATADLYPKFSLTAAAGLASAGLGRFLDAGSRTGSIGGDARWPLLDFGRARSNVAAADAREEQAFAAYESAILASLRDVDDALVASTNERARRASLEAAVAAARRAADLANRRWSAGSTDFLVVLDAQRSVLAAEDALVESDRLAASDFVALCKALGGGWQIESEAGDARPAGEPGRRALDVSGGTSAPAKK